MICSTQAIHFEGALDPECGVYPGHLAIFLGVNRVLLFSLNHSVWDRGPVKGCRSKRVALQAFEEGMSETDKARVRSNLCQRIVATAVNHPMPSWAGMHT